MKHGIQYLIEGNTALIKKNRIESNSDILISREDIYVMMIDGKKR